MSSIPRINQLNSFKPSKSPFNSTSDHFDGIDLISESSKRIKSPGVISKNPGPYKGISFKGKGDQTEIIAEEGSWYLPYSTKTLQKTRIRIPELHCHLPEPDDYVECKATIANLYPEFIGETTDTKNSPPRTIALCAYNDRTNFEEPTLLGPYSLDECVTDGTNSSNVNAPVVLQGSAATGNAPGVAPSVSGQFPSITSASPEQFKTSYPEFQFTVPPPPRDLYPIKDAVQYLSSTFDASTAIGTFAVMWAEAAKDNATDDNGAFKSPGGNNFGGVQTDSGRWSAPGISGQYSKIDSGNVRRSFAIFNTPKEFLTFLSNRISAKNMNTLDADIWTENYINRWWSPADKKSYTKGTTVYQQKKAIFLTAVRYYNKFKNIT